MASGCVAGLGSRGGRNEETLAEIIERTNKLSIDKNSIRRAGLVRTLAAKWVQFHRPDIWKIAMQEAAKKYPYSETALKKPILPPSLEKLK